MFSRNWKMQEVLVAEFNQEPKERVQKEGFEEPEASNISSQLCLPRKKQSGGYKNKLLFQRLDDLNSYT